jgi:predicted negative regulator of RcsB-dependent stress response
VDEQLHGWWQKYGQSVAIACGVVLLFYVGRMGWDYIRSEQESSLQQEFVEAKTPEQLRAFADAHPGDKLASLAEITMADQAYAAGQIPTALAAYRKAADELKGDPLGTRAEMGVAMTEIQGGQTSAGEAALRQILADNSKLAVVRVEAGYQLASLAANSGKGAETQQYAAQMMQIDPNSPWTQRAFALSLENAPAAGPASSTPAGSSVISLPAPAK